MEAETKHTPKPVTLADLLTLLDAPGHVLELFPDSDEGGADQLWLCLLIGGPVARMLQRVEPDAAAWAVLRAHDSAAPILPGPAGGMWSHAAHWQENHALLLPVG